LTLSLVWLAPGRSPWTMSSYLRSGTDKDVGLTLLGSIATLLRLQRKCALLGVSMMGDKLLTYGTSVASDFRLATTPSKVFSDCEDILEGMYEELLKNFGPTVAPVAGGLKFNNDLKSVATSMALACQLMPPAGEDPTPTVVFIEDVSSLELAANETAYVMANDATTATALTTGGAAPAPAFYMAKLYMGCKGVNDAVISPRRAGGNTVYPVAACTKIKTSVWYMLTNTSGAAQGYLCGDSTLANRRHMYVVRTIPAPMATPDADLMRAAIATGAAGRKPYVLSHDEFCGMVAVEAIASRNPDIAERGAQAISQWK